jgi:hypothetical protein
MSGFYSPWGGAASGVAVDGEGLAGMLLKRKMMEMQRQQQAREFGIEQQRLELQRQQLQALIGHQDQTIGLERERGGRDERKLQGELPEMAARTGLLGSQKAAEDEAVTGARSSRETADTLGQAMYLRMLAAQGQQAGPPVNAPGFMPPGPVQPTAITTPRDNPDLASKMASLLPMTMKKQDTGTMGEQLGALILSSLGRQAATTPGTAARLLEGNDIPYGAKNVDMLGVRGDITNERAQNPWMKVLGRGAEAMDRDGNIIASNPFTPAPEHTDATGSARLATWARMKAIGEPTTPEMDAWAKSQYSGATPSSTGGGKTITDKKGKQWRYTGTAADPTSDRDESNWEEVK